ncbi:MAG: hypothetical protein AAFY76_11820, partial [Cyanobacteria bacterium J06649_11]
LPGNRNIFDRYLRWQGNRDLVERLRNERGSFRADVTVEGERTISEAKKARKGFEKTLKTWFEDREFSSLRDWILSRGRNYFAGDPSIPIIFDFGNLEQKNRLQKLPWQVWDLFDKHLAKSEAVMAADYSQSLSNLQFPVKILAIFGSDEGGLDFEKEINALVELQNETATSDQKSQLEEDVQRVKIEILKEPTFDDLCDELIDHSWDILLFSGHSNTEDDFGESKLKINHQTTIEIGDLRHQLRIAK